MNLAARCAPSFCISSRTGLSSKASPSMRWRSSRSTSLDYWPYIAMRVCYSSCWPRSTIRARARLPLPSVRRQSPARRRFELSCKPLILALSARRSSTVTNVLILQTVDAIRCLWATSAETKHLFAQDLLVAFNKHACAFAARQQLDQPCDLDLTPQLHPKEQRALSRLYTDNPAALFYGFHTLLDTAPNLGANSILAASESMGLDMAR